MAKPKGCPYCLRQGCLMPDERPAFVEIGEFDGKEYGGEGKVVSWQCGECGEEFFAWPDDSQ